MKRIFLLMMLSISSYTVFSQTLIPDFESNVKYANHVDTLLKNHVKTFDLIIAFKTHYNWKYGSDYHLLVLSHGQWKKMILRNKPGSLARYEAPIVLKTTVKAECDSLYSKLLANNLFTIDDDQVYPTCAEVDTVMNGTHKKFHVGVDNSTGYSIWMITPAKSRQLYYYAPEYYIRYCTPYWDRRNAIDIIALFTQGW